VYVGRSWTGRSVSPPSLLFSSPLPLCPSAPHPSPVKRLLRRDRGCEANKYSKCMAVSLLEGSIVHRSVLCLTSLRGAREQKSNGLPCSPRCPSCEAGKLGGAGGPSPPLLRLPRGLVTVAPKQKHLHEHRPVLRENALISLAVFSSNDAAWQRTNVLVGVPAFTSCRPASASQTSSYSCSSC